MIDLRFSIKNYFSKEKFKNLFTKSIPLSKYKIFEFEIIRYNANWVDFEVNTNWYGYDHAGPSLELGLLGFILYVKIYDMRHWNYENNTWEEYEHTNC